MLLAQWCQPHHTRILMSKAGPCLSDAISKYIKKTQKTNRTNHCWLAKVTKMAFQNLQAWRWCIPFTDPGQFFSYASRHCREAKQSAQAASIQERCFREVSASWPWRHIPVTWDKVTTTRTVFRRDLGKGLRRIEYFSLFPFFLKERFH